MGNIPAEIAQLREDVLEDVELGVNLVKGNIALDKKKVLVLSIPYAIGWKAKVDGKTQELLCANVQNMGLLLEPGRHTVELSYETPCIKLGAFISALALIILAALLLSGRTVCSGKRNN